MSVMRARTDGPGVPVASVEKLRARRFRKPHYGKTGPATTSYARAPEPEIGETAEATDFPSTVPAREADSAAASTCIAVVDPDKTYRKAMASCLRAKGFRVLEIAVAGPCCFEALCEARADAALISTEVLEGDANEFLKALRRHQPNLQLAVVSNQDDERVEEALLSAGAADFFSRWRSSAVVPKRLSLLVEGARGVPQESDATEDAGNEETLEIGALTLRLASHRALWKGEELPLTVTEFRIVRLLATAGRKGASYRSIYDVVHGTGFNAGDGPDGYRTNVRSLVRRIRRKFRDLEPRFAAIENLAGHGYCWSSKEVEQQAESAPARPTAVKRAPRDRSEEGRIGA